MNVNRPGTAITLGRNSSMIWSTERMRSERGFIPAKKNAWLPPTTNAPTICTLGSREPRPQWLSGAGHGFKGDVLRPLGYAKHEAAVLAGYETGRYGKEEIYRPTSIKTATASVARLKRRAILSVARTTATAVETASSAR